jgi:general secretion pathway protein G
MLVVVIIGVLAAMVVPRLAGRTEQAKISRAKSDLATIELALDLYELDMGSYPTGTDLSGLRTAPSEEAERWRGPYLKKDVTDPWSKPYNYKHPSDHSQDYDLWSFGPDGQSGTDDDVANWE